jgi:hypothetical protein
MGKHIKVNNRERNIIERKKIVDVKFEVHTVVPKKTEVFWGVTPCRLVMYVITDVSEKLSAAMFR